ncbi:hypothetical protein ZWY2020_008716 [Hordeum vulgare]|nr:hypothetical protein ZWY2020_008716 [Hordeum vulgare]
MVDARHEPREAADSSTPDAADDFEFRVLSTGGLVSAGAGDMCVADELFSHGRLLPLRPSSSDALLPRSESVASTAGFGSRSDCRSASSSGSSSGCVSRSHSSKSASSDHAAPPPRRSLSSSLFYAHPSPSPQLRSRPRRSTGSAPPPAGWGFIRLGVVGAPDVYPPRCADGAKITAASRGGSGRSARFEQAASAIERSFRKHGAGLFGDRFGCKCSPDVVESVKLPGSARKSGLADGNVKRGRGGRRIRILDWLEELSTTKAKK